MTWCAVCLSVPHLHEADVAYLIHTLTLNRPQPVRNRLRRTSELRMICFSDGAGSLNLVFLRSVDGDVLRVVNMVEGKYPTSTAIVMEAAGVSVVGFYSHI